MKLKNGQRLFAILAAVNFAWVFVPPTIGWWSLVSIAGGVFGVVMYRVVKADIKERGEEYVL